ncbi:hypothetical protein ACLBWH_12220 [Sphingomonas sp. M6A6_1c]
MNDDEEFRAGYADGRDPDSPAPSANRSHAYRHSFAVGRAERANAPIPAARSRYAAAAAVQKDASR